MKTIQVGLLGCGTVGGGVVKLLQENGTTIEERLGAKVNLKCIVVRDIHAARPVKINDNLLTTDVDRIIKDPDIDIVIELIGGYSPAKQLILDAIKNRKHIVTANKALLAKFGRELFTASIEQNIDFGFEAAVGGGIPIIRSIREGFAANRFSSLYGIVNGTCNYILGKMTHEGRDFEEILKEAQAQGFAESDPTFDIEGIDSAQKIAILASIAYGGYIDFNDIYTEGISKITPMDINFAREFGYRIKLMAIARETEGEIEVRVNPAMISETEPISNVDGVLNAVEVTGDMVGETLLVGNGAGALPTASAVVGDVIEISRNILLGGVGRVKPLSYLPKHMNNEIKIKDINTIECPYYMRFSVLDKPTVLSKISGLLGKYAISIASVIQKGRNKNGGVPLVIMTHKAIESNVRKAIEEVDNLDVVLEKTVLIRVERNYNL